MTKINFTEYKTKEDFLKDFQIRSGYLDLSDKQINDNDLTHILKLIGVEPNLKELSLHSNKLTDIPTDIFNCLSSLEGLYLYDNQLETLQVGVFNGLSNLECISLYDNKLETLQMSIKKSLPNDCVIRTDNDFKWVKDENKK